MRKVAVYPQNRFEKVTRWIGLFLLAPTLLTIALPVILQLADSPEFGFSVHRLTVISVAPQGPADLAGLHPGDMVIRVQNRPVPNMNDFYATTTDMLGVAMPGNAGEDSVSYLDILEGTDVELGATLTTMDDVLRKKIEPDPARPRFLTTVYGVGYRFEMS